MISELWKTFPRMLEQKINALLDKAEPSPMKAFHLYKACQDENLWNDSFDKFKSQLNYFFSIPRFERRKSHLDTFLDRPIKSDTFENFHLDFHNSLVDRRAVLQIVSWAHNLIRVAYKTESVVISQDVLGRTLNYITEPPPFEKAENIEFEDFCSAWKKIVFRLFGKKYDQDLDNILKELRQLNSQLLLEEADPRERFVPGIYLTQTEIDWTLAVRQAVLQNAAAPKFPLSRGPQKPRLIELEKTARLYKIVLESQLPELIRHRENVRVTLLSQCDSLLRDKSH